MTFKDIIKRDIRDNFYIYELNDDNGQVATVNYMDMNYNFDEEDIENHKKGIIREIRLGKIIDDKTRDISNEIDFINKIKDPKILSDYTKEISPILRSFHIFLTEKKSISKHIPNFRGELYQKGAFNEKDKDIYMGVYKEINQIIEEVLVREYLELSYINETKNKYFFDQNPIECDNDPMIILSKINLAFQKINIDNRKEPGNLLIMNPKLYTRHKSQFMKLRCGVFLSDFISNDKIISTINSQGVEFFRFVYSFKSIRAVDEKSMNKIVKFRLDYGYEKTSISPEDNCVLINIR